MAVIRLHSVFRVFGQQQTWALSQPLLNVSAVHLNGQCVAHPHSFAKTWLNTVPLSELSSVEEGHDTSFPKQTFTQAAIMIS